MENLLEILSDSCVSYRWGAQSLFSSFTSSTTKTKGFRPSTSNWHPVKSFKNQRETMSNLRTLCRPQTVFSFISCRHQFRTRVSFRNPNCKPRLPSPSLYSTIGSWGSNPWFHVNQRRTVAKASNWAEQKSPYETLGNFYFQVCWLDNSRYWENGGKKKKNKDFDVKMKTCSWKDVSPMI